MGRVEIRNSAVIENCEIRGPVSIAEDCVLRDSYIGPFTSIGAGTIIEGSAVEHSVILENCRIHGVERLVDSLLGREAEVKSSDNKSRAVRLFVGDSARVEL